MDSDYGREYNPRDFPAVAVTVDVALFTIRRDALHILLIKRGVEPFAGAWALPGGFVRPGEDLDAAAARELAEETGVAEDSVYLEQLRSYGSPDRDPRMRVITVAYWAACSALRAPLGGSDAAHAELAPVSIVEEGGIELAFDHHQIVRDAAERVRAKLEYTALAARFCRPEFTISELREVYETIWNTDLDPGNFQRKVRVNRPFRRLGTSAPLASQRSASDFQAPRAMYMALPDANPSPANQTPADQMEFSPAQEAIPRQATAQPRFRSGRPASLWTVSDSDLTLNSPIARKRASGKG